MGISLIDMCHYIFGSETAQNRCPEKERETFWPDLKKDENGVFIIIRYLLVNTQHAGKKNQ